MAESVVTDSIIIYNNSSLTKSSLGRNRESYIDCVGGDSHSTFSFPCTSDTWYILNKLSQYEALNSLKAQTAETIFTLLDKCCLVQ